NYTEALHSYQAVIDLHPDSSFVSKAYNKLGDCYWRIDDQEKAAEAYRQTIKEYPNTAEAEYAQVCLTEILGNSTMQKKAAKKITPLLPSLGDSKKPEKTGQTEEQKLGDELNTLEKAKALFKAKDYPGARSVFQEFMKAFPKSKYNHYARLKIGETYYYEEDYGKALPEYKKVIANYPDSKYIDYCLYSAGWCHFRLKEYAESQKMFESLIKNYPQGDYIDPAKKVLPKIADLIREEKLSGLLNTAKENCEKGNLVAAKASIEQIMQEYPDSPSAKEAEPLMAEINKMLAETASKVVPQQAGGEEGTKAQRHKGTEETEGKKQEAEPQIPNLAASDRKPLSKEVAAEKPKEEKPALSDVSMLSASPHKEKPKPDKSDDLYKKALQYLGNEDYYQAIETFQKILLEYPNSSYTTLAKKGIDDASSSLKYRRIERLFEIAQRYYNMGEYEKAKQGFKSITEEYPETNQAQKAQKMIQQLSGISTEQIGEEYAAAQRCYEQGDLDKALEQFKKLVAKYPQTIYAQAAIGTIAIIQEKLSNKKAKDLYEDAKSLQEQGSYMEAINEYSKILEEYPAAYWTPYAQYAKAETLYAQQKYKEAINAWQKVLENFSGNDMSPHALYHIAECYEKLKDYKNASQSYLKLQQVYPESIYAKGALAELIKKQAARLKAEAEK
ncbi:outer membrane protein assembly factor BamD, partial [Candidatus Desantisbacteria bacterium]|nr:outer membrane protein assembly factor BamD [Candidatus Desantisbacteria bacterium]